MLYYGVGGEHAPLLSRRRDPLLWNRRGACSPPIPWSRMGSCSPPNPWSRRGSAPPIPWSWRGSALLLHGVGGEIPSYSIE